MPQELASFRLLEDANANNKPSEGEVGLQVVGKLEKGALNVNLKVAEREDLLAACAGFNTKKQKPFSEKSSSACWNEVRHFERVRALTLL